MAGWSTTRPPHPNPTPTPTPNPDPDPNPNPNPNPNRTEAKGSRGQMVEARVEGGGIQGTEVKAAQHAPHGSSHMHEPK